MENSLIKREVEVFHLALKIGLRVFKGVKQQSSIISENELIDGYMIVDEQECRILAGRNKNGAFQLEIEQVEELLSFYQEILFEEDCHA